MPDLLLTPVKIRNHDQTTQYLMPDPGMIKQLNTSCLTPALSDE